jgi:hypothetical protein
MKESMTERLKKSRSPKKTLTELMNDKSVLSGREVIQRIKDKEVLRKQFEEAVEFERRDRSHSSSDSSSASEISIE